MNELLVFDVVSSGLISEARQEVARIADLPADLRGGVSFRYSPGAQRTADVMAAQLDQAPSPERVLEWLTKLNFAMANPLTMAQLRARFSVYHGVLASSYPAPCWTDETLGDACRRCKFFPGTAELADLMDGEKARCQQVVSVLRRMATAAPPRVADRGPYPVQMPPPEVPAREGSVGFLGGRPGHHPVEPRELSRSPVPIRSVDEQLAALGFERDPANPGKARALVHPVDAA